MFDYTTTQADVTALLTEMGFRVTLEKADGNNAKSYAVWGKNEKKDVQSSISQVTGDQKILYIAGGIKKIPEVGDSIVLKTSNWSVDLVEVYQPADIVIAYKVTVSS
jgi:hypothetical protein